MAKFTPHHPFMNGLPPPAKFASPLQHFVQRKIAAQIPMAQRYVAK